jgi:hypothetical protein
MFSGSQSLEDLLAMSRTELGSLDIAWINLECAVGLPGTEEVDQTKCLRMLDEWAAQVREETEKRVPIFQANAAWHDNSEAIFRMVVLVNHLQLECGVQYNPDRIYDPDFTDSRHLFIHGLFTDHGGTCTSMPVLYVAIGRRLGYPLRLSEAKGHVFLRWDDAEGISGFPPARVNIEGATRGMNSHSDEHYLSCPMQIDRKELESGQYLHSHTPRESLALFLALRGNCLQDNCRFEEATYAYKYACLFASHIKRYAVWHDMALAMSGCPIPNGFDEFNAIVANERDRIAVLQRTQTSSSRKETGYV